jgi:hypothetical protein
MVEEKKDEVKVDVKPIQQVAKVVAKPIAKNPAKEDAWMYCKDHEPKLFKKGEEVPEGWSEKNTFGWIKDIKNNFHWRKK